MFVNLLCLISLADVICSDGEEAINIFILKDGHPRDSVRWNGVRIENTQLEFSIFNIVCLPKWGKGTIYTDAQISKAMNIAENTYEWYKQKRSAGFGTFPNMSTGNGYILGQKRTCDDEVTSYFVQSDCTVAFSIRSNKIDSVIKEPGILLTIAMAEGIPIGWVPASTPLRNQRFYFLSGQSNTECINSLTEEYSNLSSSLPSPSPLPLLSSSPLISHVIDHVIKEETNETVSESVKVPKTINKDLIIGLSIGSSGGVVLTVIVVIVIIRFRKTRSSRIIEKPLNQEPSQEEESDSVTDVYNQSRNSDPFVLN